MIWRVCIIALRGDEMDAAAVAEYLRPLETKDSPFYYTAMLTIAQKYVAAGDHANANKWIDKITADPDAPAVIRADAETLK